jgi:hypothetical protein
MMDIAADSAPQGRSASGVDSQNPIVLRINSTHYGQFAIQLNFHVIYSNREWVIFDQLNINVSHYGELRTCREREAAYRGRHQRRRR